MPTCPLHSSLVWDPLMKGNASLSCLTPAALHQTWVNQGGNIVRSQGEPKANADWG